MKCEGRIKLNIFIGNRKENEARILAKYLIAFLLQKILGRNDGVVFFTWVYPKKSK